MQSFNREEKASIRFFIRKGIEERCVIDIIDKVKFQNATRFDLVYAIVTWKFSFSQRNEIEIAVTTMMESVLQSDFAQRRILKLVIGLLYHLNLSQPLNHKHLFDCPSLHKIWNYGRFTSSTCTKENLPLLRAYIVFSFRSRSVFLRIVSSARFRRLLKLIPQNVSSDVDLNEFRNTLGIKRYKYLPLCLNLPEEIKDFSMGQQAKKHRRIQ